MFGIAFHGRQKAALVGLMVVLTGLAVVLAAEPGSARPPLDIPSAQQHDLDAINSYRAAAHAAPLKLDPQISNFALAGSQELMKDHVFHKHDKDAGSPYWETQGDANGWPIVGWPNRPDLNATIDQIMTSMMSEPFPPPTPPGYNHHSIIIDPNHTSVGVGLVVDSANGKLYFTNDFTP